MNKDLDNDYIYNYDVLDNDTVICNKLENDASNFYKEAMGVISNYSLIERLIK